MLKASPPSKNDEGDDAVARKRARFLACFQTLINYDVASDWRWRVAITFPLLDKLEAVGQHVPSAEFNHFLKLEYTVSLPPRTHCSYHILTDMAKMTKLSELALAREGSRR